MHIKHPPAGGERMGESHSHVMMSHCLDLEQTPTKKHGA